MAIPLHVQQRLHCDEDLDHEQLSSRLESMSVEELPWFLGDQAAREAFVKSVYEESYQLDVLSLEVIEEFNSFRYLQIGQLRAALAIPISGVSETLPSTGALVCLARAWVKKPELVEEASLAQIDETFRGKLLVFPVGEAKGWERGNLEGLVCGLVGCRLAGSNKTVVSPHWVSAGRVEIDPVGMVHQPSMLAGRLLQEIVAERRVRWRYVALYRVFEAAYLIGLKEGLLARFLESPKEALSDAQSALESELSTFQKLVDDKGLSAAFENIRQIVDDDSTNRFLFAIKRGLKGSKSSGFKKGVEYAYKIRCAIVHAGQRDVVFDSFADAEDGAKQLLVPMELAVLELLGIRSL